MLVQFSPSTRILTELILQTLFVFVVMTQFHREHTARRPPPPPHINGPARLSSFMVTCSIGFQYGTLFVNAVDVSGKRHYPTALRISSAALDVAIAYLLRFRLAWWRTVLICLGVIASTFITVFVFSHFRLFSFGFISLLLNWRFSKSSENWTIISYSLLSSLFWHKKSNVFFRKMERTRKPVDQGVKYHWSTL